MAWAKKKTDITDIPLYNFPMVQPGMTTAELDEVLQARELLLFPQIGERTPGAVIYEDITIEAVENFMLSIGLKYRGRWQRRIMQRLIDERFVIVKGPRQNSGKTWCIAVLLAFCICKLGMAWVIAMPTLRQGSRILIDRVSGMCAQYELRNTELERVIKNANYMTWNNGGLLGVVSLHEGSRAGVQGYTAVGLVIDEAHETDRTIYDAVLPVLDVAAADGQSRVIISGIGGYPNFSLIWELQQPPEEGGDEGEIDKFSLVHITPEEISADSEKLRVFFAKKQRSVPEPVWRRNYKCEDFTEHGSTIFPELIDGFPGLHMSEGRYEFGIDVGGRGGEDYTCVVAMRIYGDYAELYDADVMRGLNFDAQAERITTWIDQYPYLPHNVRIEKNSIGVGLYDFMRKHSGFHNIVPVVTTDVAPHYSKSTWIQRLMQRARIGKLAVPNPRFRRQLQSLQFEQRKDGSYEWPHSDLLSALWVWEARTGRAFAG